MVSQTSEMGLSHSLALDSLPNPLLRLPDWTSVGKDAPRPAWNKCASIGWYPRGLFFSEEKVKEQWEMICDMWEWDWEERRLEAMIRR